MTRNYFREGGPYNAKRIGRDHIELELHIEPDEEGRVARSCPVENCSPGYFKVRFGTGIQEAQEVVYCPYCRQANQPSAYFTEEQIRFAKDALVHEMAHAFQRAIGGAVGTRRGPVSFKPGRISLPRQPYEDTVQRNVICPYCTLEHAVYGLAMWCPDCGSDVFLTHIQAELQVVRSMLSDIERRHELLGARIAAKDLENCLEDVVSIYEAVLKAQLTRYLRQKGMDRDAVEHLLSKKVRNAFQNVERSRQIILEHTGYELFDGIKDRAVSELNKAFEMRHPITHNLGVIDRKYLERSLEQEREGREVRVTRSIIEQSLETSLAIVSELHRRLFPNDAITPGGDLP